MYADWALNGIAMRDGNGEIVETAMAFLDLTDSACTIIDNWHVAGLAGSGSHMIVANDLFVPDAMILRPSQNPPAEALLVVEGAEPRDRLPMETLFPLGVAAPIDRKGHRLEPKTLRGHRIAFS